METGRHYRELNRMMVYSVRTDVYEFVLMWTTIKACVRVCISCTQFMCDIKACVLSLALTSLRGETGTLFHYLKKCLLELQQKNKKKYTTTMFWVGACEDDAKDATKGQ